MTRSRQRLRVVACLVALGTVIAGACGGDDSPSPTVPAAPAAATQAGATATTAPGTAAATTAASTAAAPAQTSATDPCRLFSKQELETAAGFTLDNGALQRIPVGDVCFFSQQGSGIISGNVSVTLLRSSTARAMFETILKERNVGTEVPAIGDRTFVNVTEIQGNILLLKGNTVLAVDIVHSGGRGSEAQVRERLLTLARLAASRL